jgi:hypothetical protein
MSTQMNNPANPADPATQAPVAAPSQLGAEPSQAGGPPTPAATDPPALETFSSSWFQEEDPQILIQWSLQPAPGSSSSGSDDPMYAAQVRIYQLIFDTTLPGSPQRGSAVPFSVTDPSVGTAPFLQGSFVLSQTPPTLEVVNLRFPGFQAQNVTLYSPTPSGPSPASTSQPAADEVAAEEATEA